MDENVKMKLDRMLENGEISKEIYDDIVSRWSSSDGSDNAQCNKTGRDESPRDEDAGSGRRVITLSGSGTLADAIADELVISGSGVINGPVIVDKATISGSGKVGRDFTSRVQLNVSGTLRVSSDITGDTVVSSGSISAANIACKVFSSSGSAEVDGLLRSDRLKTTGTLRAGRLEFKELDGFGVIKSESLTGESIRIRGALNASEITSGSFNLESMGWGTEIGLLKAEHVKVSSRRRLVFKNAKAEIREIHGGVVEIENVRCGKIFADKVTVGANCQVDYVEAHEITASEKSRIMEKKII